MATLEDKIARLPPEMREEVENFIDFISIKRESALWQKWLNFLEATDLAESDFADYLKNLQDYETRLARGEIKW